MSLSPDTIKLFHHLKSVNDFDLLKRLAVENAEKIQEEMAVPAYFKGNLFSRLLFFGRLARFLQPIEFLSGSAVLDFGCGTGLLAPFFIEKGSSYCGIDLTPETARRYATELDLTHAEFHHSLHALVPGQKFDQIISFDVLEHVVDLEKILEQFKSILNPGGRIAICGPTENRLYRFGRKLVGFSGEYHHRDIENIFSAATQSGFRLARKRAWPLPGPAALFRCGYFTI